MKRARSPGASAVKKVKMAPPGPEKGGYGREIPRYLQYTSPAVSTIPPKEGGQRNATTLPLNLIAQIVAHLEDIGDIARVTRTCRLLYYMTLPQLYRKVDLHSYGEMRYVNGRPEGFGSGSPFMMALNGLVTKAHGSLVEEFRVWGKWQELGIEDFAKGRVPDNSMMLNILLRAGTDKMTKLKSFCWELNCKPLKTLYQGLGAHNTLTTFTLRFPSTRVPRPSVLVPPMVNLRAFKALDVDPMCYPDDLNMLMLHSKKLEDVRLHFSPRMRAEAESVMNLNMFFGRCHKANYKLKLKHFALQNWFGPNVLGFDQIFDAEGCGSITFLDTFGGNDPRTVFVDDTWKDVPDLETTFEHVRINEVSPAHIGIMKKAKVSMKYFYLVTNSKKTKTGFTPSSNGYSPNTNTPTVETPYDPNTDPEWIALGHEYIEVIGKHHGATLKHLLLSDLWPVTSEQLSGLLRQTPNLEQFGLAIDNPDYDSLGVLLPLLPKLKCLRILDNDHLKRHMTLYTHDQRMWYLGMELARYPASKVELISVGDVSYRVGRLVELMREDGTIEARREMSIVDHSEAMGYSIWRLDVLDISVDPIAPFTP